MPAAVTTVMMAITITMLRNLGARDIKIKDIILPPKSLRFSQEVGKINTKIQRNVHVVGFLTIRVPASGYILVRLYIHVGQDKKPIILELESLP